MKRSTERIPATHVGSLARPESLIELMWARERGAPCGRAAMSSGVAGEKIEGGSGCGFASLATRKPEIPPGIVRAKMASLAGGARRDSRIQFPEVLS